MGGDCKEEVGVGSTNGHKGETPTRNTSSVLSGLKVPNPSWARANWQVPTCT